MALDNTAEGESQAFAQQFSQQNLSRQSQGETLGSGTWASGNTTEGDVMATPLQGNATDQNLAMQVMEAYQTGGAQGAAQLGNQFDALSLQDQQAVAADINQMSGGQIMAGIQGDNNGNSTLLIGNEADGFSQIDWGNNIDATGLTYNAAQSLIQGDSTGTGGDGGGAAAGGGGGGSW
ncbi:MAG TPA: hypothetical protein V6C81_04285 [Planktothrix sp.]|jgi:hypothetical protein